jgi:hypothetical protein
MLKEKLNALLRIDRRCIFLGLTVVLFGAIMRPLGLINKEISKDTRNAYDFMEKLPAGSFVILSLDYDPSTAPELNPQAVAVARHAFRKNLRVGVVTYAAGATGLIEQLFAVVPAEFKKEYGRDYIIFPYQPSAVAALTQMASDLYGIYDKDKDGKDAKSMPVMLGVKNYKNVSLVVCIAGTQIPTYWVQYAGDKYGVPVMAGVTAISQPGYGPYLQKKQLKGLLGGMKGAAEYEHLIDTPGKGTSGIDALSLAHVMVVGLIIVSNIAMVILKYL